MAASIPPGQGFPARMPWSYPGKVPSVAVVSVELPTLGTYVGVSWEPRRESWNVITMLRREN